MFVETINKVNDLLEKERIPYQYLPLFDGAQWRFSFLHGDLAVHSGTYASDLGFIESFQMPWDYDDVTVDTPEAMVHRVAAYYRDAGMYSPTNLDVIHPNHILDFYQNLQYTYFRK